MKRYAHLRRWRDRYIACKLEVVGQRLRDKGRYLDEMEDSATAVERQVGGHGWGWARPCRRAEGGARGLALQRLASHKPRALRPWLAQAQEALKRLNQLDRTLGQRRAELNCQLAELSGHSGTHMGSRRGKVGGGGRALVMCAATRLLVGWTFC